MSLVILCIFWLKQWVTLGYSKTCISILKYLNQIQMLTKEAARMTLNNNSGPSLLSQDKDFKY